MLTNIAPEPSIASRNDNRINTMLTLFHAPRSRSTRFIWLLEELGAPYAIRKVDIYRAVSQSGARDPANPHPHGQVPALSDDGTLITESSAIALYLTDKFPDAGLGPVVGDPLRGSLPDLARLLCRRSGARRHQPLEAASGRSG